MVNIGVYARILVGVNKDTERLLFAARYLKKCPVSNERLRIIEATGEATIEYASYKNGVKNVRRFTPLQFLAL